MIATFNYVNFALRYPEFANLPGTKIQQLNLIFTQDAGLYLNNTDCSIVQNITRRTILLNMLTAHIAFLGGMLSADGQALPVGRVSEAHEGTVGASLEYTAPEPGSGPWFNQTAYGAAFWQATTSLRGMHYRPRATDVNQGRGPLIGGYGAVNTNQGN